MTMRNPNGYGGVVKLSGNRRKPYMAYLTSMESEGTIIQQEDKRLLEERLDTLRRTSDEDVMWEMARKIISTTHEDPKAYLLEICEQSASKGIYKAKQIKHPLGYFATRKEANICLAEYNKGRVDIDSIEMTFRQAYEGAYKASNIAEKSQSLKYQWSQSFDKCEEIADKTLRKITLADLQKIMDRYDGTSTSTQSALLGVIKRTMSYGMQHDAIAKDYSQFLSVGKVKEARDKNPYTREEIARLWQIADADKLIMIYTGLRVGEYVALTKEDINLEERIISVHGTKTKNAERLVPIHKDIIPLLKTWRRTMSRRQIQAAFGDGHTAHDCRHTFVTYTYGINEALRKFIVGHSGGLTQDTYTHPEVLKKELVDAIDTVKFID